ncbi:13697_t:CDS:2 [Entrophospora sp. SA101]|nr:13697_t:CDS:2 [Entrophospora sp. SA101]
MIKPDRPPFCPHSGNIRLASGTIYIGERPSNEKTYKSKVVMYPSKKKENIMTKASQYIFLRCPGISLFEWYRLFYLTSAPEEDYISKHLGLGEYDWKQFLIIAAAGCKSVKSDDTVTTIITLATALLISSFCYASFGKGLSQEQFQAKAQPG